MSSESTTIRSSLRPVCSARRPRAVELADVPSERQFEVQILTPDPSVWPLSPAYSRHVSHLLTARTQTRVHTHTGPHTHLHRHMCTCACTERHVCIHAHMSTHAHMPVCAEVCVRVHAYTCACTCAHTCTYACALREAHVYMHRYPHARAQAHTGISSWVNTEVTGQASEEGVPVGLPPPAPLCSSVTRSERAFPSLTPHGGNHRHSLSRLPRGSGALPCSRTGSRAPWPCPASAACLGGRDPPASRRTPRGHGRR